MDVFDYIRQQKNPKKDPRLGIEKPRTTKELREYFKDKVEIINAQEI